MGGHALHETHQTVSPFERADRCQGLPHRPRVLLAKMGLDGHDRGVKVIARALRDSGVHLIYSGLWQTPATVAQAARDEDVDVIAASMMSNAHRALTPKLMDSLREYGRPDIPVYMGGILPAEDIQGLYDLGVAKCFTTGTSLADIVNSVLESVRDRQTHGVDESNAVSKLSRDISFVHESSGEAKPAAQMRRPKRVIGVTGSPGAGKSTLVAQLVGEHARRAQGEASLGRCAVVAFDPVSPFTSGAMLGDRLRVDFNDLGEAVYYRSLAIGGEDYRGLETILGLIGGAFPEGDKNAYETVFVETVGAGQNEVRIREHVDQTAVVLTPGMGDAIQMDKAGILEIADMFICNKADQPGEDALVRNLTDIAAGRRVLETVATRGRGIPELLDVLLELGS